MTVLYETAEAVFAFEIADVKNHLENILPEKHSKKWIKKLDEMAATGNLVLRGNKYRDIGYIAVDLLESGKGSVFCKLCNRPYKPDQLQLMPVGHGRSPFNLKKKMKGGVFIRLFAKKRNPSLFGGRGYLCSVGHELISTVDWMT